MTGSIFRPIVTKRSVRLDWYAWNRTADEPARYPDGGDPETHILGHRHSPKLAAQRAAKPLTDSCQHVRV